MTARNFFFAVTAFLLTIILATSCNTTTRRNDKIRSIGNTSEILVVVENEQQWDNSTGKAIRDYLGKSQYGLNQDEPIFDIAHIQKSSFTDLFGKHRNLLIIKTDKQLAEPKIEIKKDIWAAPQRVVTITAPSSHLITETFNKYAESIRLAFNQAERERINVVFEASSPNKITDAVKKRFGFDITIPRQFFVAKDLDDFMWIRKETEAFSQGMIFLTEPYLDTAQFSNESIVSRINRFQQQYVPGALEGTFMSTDKEYYPPVSHLVNDFVTDYAVETRGLWKVEGDFMSGPFVSYTFINPNNNQLVTLMGYVYQPNKEKRDLLRQLESILYSVHFDS